MKILLSVVHMAVCGEVSFVPRGAAAVEATDGGEVYSPNVGGKRFLKNKFFSLGRRTPWRPPTVEKCTFLLCNRKVPKECTKGGEPTVRPLWTPPLP